MKYSSRAIILKRVAYGEADWIVTFFCRERGRLSGMARSARSSRKRFAGALEPGSVVDLRYTERSGSSLAHLDEARVAFPIHGVMKSLPRIEALSRAVKLALAFLPDGDANPVKFDLLAHRFMRLSEAEPDPLEGAAFEFRWLALCGFAPVLCECVSCGAGATEGGSSWRMSYEKGGLVCSRCAWGGAAPMVDAEAMRGLGALSRGDEAVDAPDAAAAGQVLCGYIDHVLGRPLSSPAY